MQEAPWRALLEILGSPTWGDDEVFATHPSRSQYWDALEPLLQEELRKHPAAKLYEEGQRRGIAIAPVNTVAQAAAARQFAERGFFVRLPGLEGELTAPGSPFRLGEPVPPRPAPAPGQDNQRVLADWLGHSPEELSAAGVIL
jgi:crotonobetainyl-CoA:carnitine CoA-transferase CaiB-like acyl-CoA transferase